MRCRGCAIVLLVAVLALFPRPSGAQDSWLDGGREGWNAAGTSVPVPPVPAVADAGICAQFVRPPETAEDAAVAAQGWLLLPSFERGWDVTLVGAAVGFDAMCRPVYYQQFVFVGGAFAGTLAPGPMVPRTDGALTDAGISTADRLYATYSRYAPTDPLCCPSGETQLSFAIERSPAGPVVIPGDGQTAATAAGARSPATPAGATIPVCVILGTSDDISLVSWSEAEIAAYEATGEPLATPHPKTETCRDPAGLPVIRDFLGGFTWVCLPTAGGGWYGPQWTAEIYLPANAVPPDPALAGDSEASDEPSLGCPSPRDAAIPPPPEPELAAATAVYISQLEAAGDLDTLYAWLHPDAQAVVPPEAVGGWYAADWLPRGPEQVDVSSVAFGEWTWEVTGTTYPNAAEISYEQRFADGSVVSEVMRLVEDDQGVWRWFFGRDRAFVDAQIARFGG